MYQLLFFAKINKTIKEKQTNDNNKLNTLFFERQ